MFSSIQYKLKTVVVSLKIIEARIIEVHLTENINVLDQVTVGKVLTGDLSSDINNSDLERPINFYDLGIPGNTAKPKTQSERRLYEAGEFKPKQLLGLLMGSMPINPILNAISGRTKMLKQRVKLEVEEQLMYSIKARLSEDFFSVYSLDETLQMEFFYFCSEDENFSKRCKDKSDIDVLEYLKEKYLEYNKNLNQIKD